MSKRLIIILAVILALVAASEALVPTVVSDIVARGMANLTGSDNVSVTVVKHPAIYMFGGQFDQITVQETNAKIDKITFSDMKVALSNAQLDMGALVSHRQIVLKTVQDVDLSVTVTQEELANYLNQAVKGVKNSTVAITPENVKVSSNFAIGGFANVAVTLEGKIIGEGQKIKFVTERFLLNNMLVGNIGGSVLTEIQLVDLKKLPFNVSVRDIDMEQGKVIINTDNRPR